MTRVEKLTWMLGSVAVFAGVGLVGLMLPRVQTAIARQVLAGQPGIFVTFEQVKLRPGSLEVRNLAYAEGPIAARVPALRVELPFWRLLTATPRIDRLEARGWEVTWNGNLPDAPEESPPRRDGAGWSELLATVSANPPVAPGMIESWSARLAEPLPVSVGEIALEGNAAWRQAGPGADGQARIRIGGHGPAIGDRHHLRIDVLATGAKASARGIQILEIGSDLTTTLHADGRISAFGLDTQLTAKLEGGAEDRIYGLTLNLDKSGEAPHLRLELRDAAEPLVSADLSADDGVSQLEGDWRMSLDAMNASHLMLGRELPEFALRGSGRLSASSDLSDITLGGDLDYAVGDLSMWDPALAAVGDVTGNLGFEVKQLGDDTRFTRWDFSLAGAAPVLRVGLLQGIEIGRDVYELRVAAADKPVLEIDLQGVPLAWVQPWLEPWVLDARPVQGRLVGLVTPLGLRLVTSEPLRLDRAAFAQAGKTWADEIDIEIDLGTEITPAGWQVELGNVAVSRRGQEVVNLQARGGQLQNDDNMLKMVGRVEADLAALLQWPGFAGVGQLSAGRLEAEFGIGLEERLSLATAVSVKELVSLAGTSLPAVNMDGRVDLLADGAIELHLPTELVRDKRTSEATLNLRADPAGSGWRVESSLSGPIVHAQDVQVLRELLPVEDSLSTATSGRVDGFSPVQAAVNAPAWSGIVGTLQTTLGELLIEGTPTLHRLSAAIAVERDVVNLETFTAKIGEGGSMQGSGQLMFDAEAPLAYRGTGQLNLANVAVDPWLRWVEPTAEPVLTGRLNLTAQWHSEAAVLEDLGEAGVLTARIDSAGGVIRALGVQVENSIRTGQTVAALGSLFGAVTGNQDVQRYANRVQSIATAASLLQAVAFDQLSLNIDRLPSGDIVLSDLSLIAPMLRMLGEGRITYQPGQAFWVQPLALSLSLSARDELGQALQQLGLVRAGEDSLGYLPLIESFTLDGSLVNIGTAEFERLLMRSLR